MENEQKEFNKKLDELRKNMIFELSNWWGHQFAGYGGRIVTSNKELYYYEFYHLTLDYERNKGKIEKIKDLTDEEYARVINFIETEIKGKEFEDNRIFDAGYDVIVKYNGINKKIVNNIGFNDNPGLYDKADALIKELM